MARIFVVDDDAELLTMIGIMLRRAGHTVELMNEPKRGLEKILLEQPDLVVLDLMMPGMNGFELCHAIRNNAATEKTPILIVTARMRSSDRVQAYELGASDYLLKPISSRQLTDRIDQLLEDLDLAEQEIPS